MALSRNGKIFYEEIFPKLIYDKEEGKYKLNLTAYIPSNLNKRQTRILERICLNNDIIMEKLPEKVSVMEAENLFIKLKTLKEVIDKTNNPNEKKLKEKEYYQVRTKIFEGHQQLVYKLIMEHYPDIESSPFKEDIIQSCYQLLLKAIDNYNNEIGNQNFRWYLHYYASKNMLRTITYIKNNGLNKDLIDIIEIREKENNPTISELSILSNLTPQRIEELLTLEQMLNPISIEEIKENPDFKIDSQFDLEENINKELLQELLILLIDTIQNEKQREVLKLYFGLGKIESYRIKEIAEMLYTSRQRIDQLRNGGIELLTHPSRLKYIKELYLGYTNNQFPQLSEENLVINETDLVYEKLEKYLFKILFTKEEITSLINNIPTKYQKVLLIHFDLTDDILITFKDKINKNNLSSATYTKRKKEGLSLLRIIFKEIYIDNQQNENIKTVLDYLMYAYLNKNINKVKTRKKDGNH